MSSSLRFSTNDVLRVDDICDQFEADLRSGVGKPLGFYLDSNSQVRGDLRNRLAESLLLAEWDYQFEHSTGPNLAEYLAAPPMPAGSIRQLFESWRARRTGESSFAGYQLVERLGQGRFGTVWKAWDPNLRRLVALKIAHPSLVDDEESFFRESKTAARLQHPHIATIISAGQWQGRPYIVREYVVGETLSRVLKRETLNPEKAASLCWQLALALAYSHRLGCIHRDLKPGNILIRDSGQPCIIDFGLGKTIDESAQMTGSNTVMGTPVYMSPEQARGDSKLADQRSDIYSLGVVLFETLTGQRPFNGSFDSTMYEVLTKQPPDPRSLNPSIPTQLATICFKCLQKDPDQRYASADDLAADLKRSLDGEPILAVPESQWARAARFARANPTIAALGVCSFVLLLTLAIGAVYSRQQMSVMLQQANQLRQEARSEANSANELAIQMVSMFSIADPLGDRRIGSPKLGNPDMTAKEILELSRNSLQINSETKPRLAAQMMDVLACINCNLGRYAQASELLDDAERIRNTTKYKLPATDLRRDEATHLLYRGRLLHHQGQLHAAENCLTSCRIMLEKNDWGDELQMSEVLLELGWVHNELQQPEVAEPYFDRCIQIRVKFLAPQDPLLLWARLGKSSCRIENGNLKDIAWPIIQSYVFRQPQLAVILSLVLLGDQANRARNFQLAANLKGRLLKELEHLGLKDDRWYLLAQGDYANTLFELGDYRNAIEQIESAIEVGEKLAPQHHHLQDAYKKLAYETFLAGRHEESENYWRLASANGVWDKKLSDDKVMWRAENLVAAGKYGQATEILNSVNFSKLGQPCQVWYHLLLGQISLGLDETYRAESYFRMAKATLDQCDRDKPASTELDHFASVFEWAGEPEEVERMLRLALEKEIKRRHATHPRTADRMFRLADFLRSNGGVEEAISLLKQSLEIRLKCLPADDQRIAKTQELLDLVTQQPDN